MASAVATDYSELGPERDKYKSGQAYIKYRKGLEREALKIKASLEELSGIQTVITKEVSAFRTGDIPIALFWPNKSINLDARKLVPITRAL